MQHLPSAEPLDARLRTAVAVDIFKALGHPLRLQIVALLADAPLHVTALAARLGARQSIVSQQLRILRSLGLVSGEHAGGHTTYRITRPRLRELLRCVEGCTSHD